MIIITMKIIGYLVLFAGPIYMAIKVVEFLKACGL